MDELVADFLNETRESLEVLDNDLLRLERSPEDAGVIGNIFRVMHTIKGTCGFLGLHRLESVAHAGENILDKIREGELTAKPHIVTAILEAVDHIKTLLDALETTETEPKGEDSELIAHLNALAAGQTPPPRAVTLQAAAAPPEADETEAELDEATAPEDEELTVAEEPAQLAPAPVQSVVKPKEEQGHDSDALQRLFDSTPSSFDPDAFRRICESEKAEEELRRKSKEKAKEDETRSGKKSGEDKSSDGIRVSLDALEQLMQHASELVLTRNQLLQILRGEESSQFAAGLQRLNLITTELQEQVMKTRMQPVSAAWAKLPRIVRDLSLELNKKINLVMEGEETELDRQLLDRIRDPLMHMVRNSADHGVESPEERKFHGKPETGTIRLSAYQGGGYIIMEISDDGAGVNIERVRSRAVEKGLVSAQEAETLSQEQILQFIFAPGFSTAEKVTSVSGRGVGMDVVKTNIERINGSVNLKTEQGKGSKFIIKIPLTLAIMPILEVECRGQSFAIPQINVAEVVKTSPGSAETPLEYIKDCPVLRLRNNLVPLIFLDKTLGLPGDPTALERAFYVIVCTIGEAQFGVIVDKVYDTEEIVVKPLTSLLRGCDIYSGCTILGNGKVIMILDPSFLSKAVGSVAAASKSASGYRRHLEEDDAELLSSFVVFRAGNSTPKAVPLELLSRLESIHASSVEYSQGQPVLQYRGVWMRLIQADGSLQFPEEGDIELLVFNNKKHVIGVAVDKIMDIARAGLPAEGVHRSADGYTGSLIINGETCDILDVSWYFRMLHADDESGLKDSGKHSVNRKKVLLADDSAFFRKFITQELENVGYEVHTVSDGREAASYLCEPAQSVDAVVTDIMMPGMSGSELAALIKSTPRLTGVPVIALSSCNTDYGDVLADKRFDYFIAKTNHAELPDALMRLGV